MKKYVKKLVESLFDDNDLDNILNNSILDDYIKVYNYIYFNSYKELCDNMKSEYNKFGTLIFKTTGRNNKFILAAINKQNVKNKIDNNSIIYCIQELNNKGYQLEFINLGNNIWVYYQWIGIDKDFMWCDYEAGKLKYEDVWTSEDGYDNTITQIIGSYSEDILIGDNIFKEINKSKYDLYLPSTNELYNYNSILVKTRLYEYKELSRLSRNPEKTYMSSAQNDDDEEMIDFVTFDCDDIDYDAGYKYDYYYSIVFNYFNYIDNVNESKKLNESLFDDDEDDILGTDDTLSDIINKDFTKILKDTLCQESNYHYVISDAEDGLPEILEQNGTYYIAPYRTYKSCNFGSRKRKNYDLQYFYRYILTLDGNGYTLKIAKGNDKSNLVIGEQLFNFLSNSTIELDKIELFNPNGVMTNYKYTGKPFDKMYIIDGAKYGTKKHLSNMFVDNFPTIIEPGGNESNKKPVMQISRDWFTDDTYFIKFVKKLVNNNLPIEDNDGILYNKENIDNREQELLSGKQDNDVQQINNDKIQFIINELGQDNIDKFNKIVDYIKNNVPKANGIVTLKIINTLRTEKINLTNTVTYLRKDNNLCISKHIGEDEYTNASREEYIIKNQIFWKMLCILKDEHLNVFKIQYNYGDCIDGIDLPSYAGYYASTVFHPDINNLPIKFEEISDIYKLYYVIGKAITESDSLYELNQNNDWNLYGDEVTKLNNNISFNIHNFDYTYLTKQLKTIIDKTYKKYKLHKVK